jgi:hypothetical protein
MRRHEVHGQPFLVAPFKEVADPDGLPVESIDVRYLFAGQPAYGHRARFCLTKKESAHICQWSLHVVVFHLAIKSRVRNEIARRRSANTQFLVDGLDRPDCSLVQGIIL